jgi:hypothetical protein
MKMYTLNRRIAIAIPLSWLCIKIHDTAAPTVGTAIHVTVNTFF